MERIETFRGRQLRRELLRLRDAAGMSTDQVASELYWSKGKISRIETGKSSVRPSDVRLLLDVYGITDPGIRQALIDLARAARRKGWWEGLPSSFGSSYIALESEAEELRSYESYAVPGLLQTEDYFRSLARAARSEMPADELDQRLTVRMTRQERLRGKDGPRLWVVIDEAVLRRPVGGSKIMQNQLRKISEASDLPNVTIQVMPFAAGAHAAHGVAFMILDVMGPTDLTVVYLEHLGGGLFLDDEPSVARHTLTFDHLRAKAADPDILDEIISRSAAEL